MSEFADKQKDECEEIKKELLEEVEEKFCPSCVPNPYAPEIDWVNEKDPYFDPRTCEYIANVSFHKVHDVFQRGVQVAQSPDGSIRSIKVYTSLREYVDDFRELGTEKLLRHFGKKVSEETLSLSFVPDDGIFVSSNSVINFKIVIVAERFNAIGELTQEDLDEQQQPENNTAFPDILTIDDSRFELWEKLITTHLGILAYEGRYSYFRNVDDGVIKYDKDKELTFFKPKDIRDSLEDLKKALDKILKTNGMSFYSVSSFFAIYDTVTKIEIEFDNSDENKPFKIHKIFATSGDCPRKELFKGLDTFKEEGYLPTALFYMTNFEKAYSDLTATEPRDWIEFFEEYTYPPIEVIYGSSGEEIKIEESALACALDVDLGELTSGLLEDFFSSAWDIFSNNFDLTACSDDPVDREPALKEFIRPDLQKQYEKIYKEELKRLRKNKQPRINEIYQRNVSTMETTIGIAEQEESYRKELAEIESDLRKEAAQKAEEKINKMKKENFLHPFYEHFKSSLGQRIKNDQSVLAIFKKIQKDPKLTETSKIEKFIQSIGMCGIASGFKKALGCLMKQVDLKTIITSTIRMFFKGFKIQDLSNALKDLLLFLPADKQVEVQLKIEEKLGKIKPPWETLSTNPDQKSASGEEKRTRGVLRGPDGRPLTENIDGKEVPITQGALGDETNRGTGSETQDGQFSEDLSRTINQSMELILETYLEELLGAASVDELIKKYKNEIPALGPILKPLIGNCKTSRIKDINNSLLPEYKFDICNPAFPTVRPKLPTLKWKPNIWSTFKNNIKKAIREAILRAITALVMKLVNLLEQKLCASLESLGKIGLDVLEGKDVDFSGILKEAFCPDASDDEVKDLGNSLLNKIGAKDTDIQNAFDCFSGAIFGSMTQREMIDLITLKEKNSVDIEMFMQTIKVGCPPMYDLVNTPNKATNFFNNIGNLIPQDTRNLLQSSIPFSSDDLPFYNSICLTSEELRAWDQIRRQGLENAGMNPEDAANQVDLYNQRARDALNDIMDALNNDPNGNINDMIQDLFSPLTNDDCDKENLKEGESLFGNKVSREPEELVNLQNDISNRIFDNILDQVNRDFSNSLFFGGSLLEKILTDTRDNNLGLHNLYKTLIFTRNKYHDSLMTQEQKGERFLFFGLDLGEHRGYFPETIGLFCKQQLEANEIEYISVSEFEETTQTSFDPLSIEGPISVEVVESEIEKSAFELLFEREYSKASTFFPAKKVEGKISFISEDLHSGERNLNYKVKSSYDAQISYEDIASNNVSNNNLENLEIESSTGTEYRLSVFNAFINKKLDVINNKPNLSNVKNFTSAFENIFSNTIKIILDNTEGFQFGFEDEDIVEEDLTYVNPEENSSEYTYENKDKILGRSKTNHPRVTFLNPENYGGSYKVPPVYIKPKKMNGWMKYSKDLFPEEEECEPKTQTIINSEKIKGFINNRRNTSILQNEEMEKMSKKCYFDRPFNKVLTKNALSSIEGLIKIQIRTSIVKEMIKSIPAISCLKYTTENYDTTSANTIVNRMIDELKSVNPFGPYKLEKQNYYLIFLEQAVQFFINTTIAELPNKIDPETGEEMEEKDFSSLGEDIENAYNKIKSFTDNFSYLNAVSPEAMEIEFLGNDEWSADILSFDTFNHLAGAYQKVGDEIFDSTKSYDYSPDFLQSEATTNLYSVIFAVRLCEKEAKTILKHLINAEYEELIKDFYKRENAIIDDIGKVILTSSELFEENELENFGFTQYEKKIAIGSFQSMGQPNDVVDVETIDPFDSSSRFGLKIEKYIRIKEKEDLDLPEEVMTLLNSRDHNLKGVVSLQNLQNFFNQNSDLLGEYNISDLFGDARIEEPEETEEPEDIATEVLEGTGELVGNIGLNSGIRIVMRLPELDDEDETPEASLEDLQFSNLEKAYCVQYSNKNLSIPITSAEVEIMDTKIKNLNLQEIYDVDCLARKMTNSVDYNILFKKIIPIQAASSMVLQYMNYFFLDSIGVAADERVPEVENPKRIEMPDFNGTNLQIRKHFACFYNSNRTLHSENFRLPKIEFPDFWKMLFGNFKAPEINLNLVLFDLKFDHKVVKINPFDANDNICDE